MTRTIEATSRGIPAAPDSAPGAQIKSPPHPTHLWLTAGEAVSGNDTTTRVCPDAKNIGAFLTP